MRLADGRPAQEPRYPAGWVVIDTETYARYGRLNISAPNIQQVPRTYSIEGDHGRWRSPLAEAIRQRILTSRGEWFVDPEVGVPFVPFGGKK